MKSIPLIYLLFHQINQNMWIRIKVLQNSTNFDKKLRFFLILHGNIKLLQKFTKIKFSNVHLLAHCVGDALIPPSPPAPLSFWGDRSVKITGKDWRALLQWNWRENWRSLLHAFYHILWHKNLQILMPKKRYLHIFYLSGVFKPLGLSLIRY